MNLSRCSFSYQSSNGHFIFCWKYWLHVFTRNISPEKLTDKGGNGAPDRIIEIVSPGSRRTDYYTKLFKYRTAGVREYWIVDPEKNRITVYSFESDDTAEYTFSEAVKAGIYDNLEIDFSSIDI